MTIPCPKCGRFLMEIGDYGRAVCRDCGVQITVETKRVGSRRRTAGVDA